MTAANQRQKEKEMHRGGAVAKWSKALLLISLLKKINENHKKNQGSPRHLKKETQLNFAG